MIKKVILLGLILAISLVLASPAYCGDTFYKKLGRGLCNIIMCPFEIPEQMSRVNSSDGPMAGLTWGLVKGVAMTGVRAVVGVYETVTFPIPLPKDYAPILKDPEFFFENMNW